MGKEGSEWQRTWSAVLGHENAGVVVVVGEGVTGLKPGDRVAVEPIHSCLQFGGSCPWCRVGKYQLCQGGLTHVGMPLTRMLPGGFGEFSAVHESRFFPLPAHLSFEDGALLDILAVAVHAVHIGRPGIGISAAVVGCGVLGLDMIQCLCAHGVRDVVAVARYPLQAAAARELGATEVVLADGETDPVRQVLELTGGRGVDQVYECVGGETSAVAESLAMCATGGSVIMLGGASTPKPIDLQAMLLKEANLLACNSYATEGTRREFAIALQLLSAGQVRHDTLVTQRFAPREYQRALAAAMARGEHGVIKAVFVRA